MSDTVFILGAGASKQAGVPLMKDFLDTAHQLWKTGKISPEDEDSFQKVFDGISQLQLVHSKSQLDIQNVESVFAAFEMGRILKRFTDYSCNQIEELVNAMRQVIVRTIEKTMKLSLHKDNLPREPEPYHDFRNLVRYLRTEVNPEHSVSIITFNYDMAIDYSFYLDSIPLDYSLGGKIDGIPVLKLHGSLNWARCSVCKEVIPWFLSDFFNKFKCQEIYIERSPGSSYAILNIGKDLPAFKHCGKNVSEEPVIIPPTWNKTEYYPTLSNVWSRAAKELSDAENIFVIGYSLPPSDAFFRYLYALGTVGRNPFKRFWVFNPDDSGETENRFRELLGPGAEVRFQYHKQTFSHSFRIIRQEFPER